MIVKETSTGVGVGLGDELDTARTLYARDQFAEAAKLAKQIFKESADEGRKFDAATLASSAEAEQGHYISAHKSLEMAASFLDDATPRRKANFYGQRAYLGTKLGESETALIDYEAARFWALEAGDARIVAQIRNNLAMQYSNAGRFGEAITEVDAAIKTGIHLHNDVLLGRCYDQKAQILIDHAHYADAIIYSQKAIRLLENHSSLLVEARTTHGRALIALGSCYLEQDDPIETFRSRRKAAKHITVTLDAALLKLALDRAEGNVLKASQILQMKHPTIIEAVKRHGLTRQATRTRGRPITRK